MKGRCSQWRYYHCHQVAEGLGVYGLTLTTHNICLEACIWFHYDQLNGNTFFSLIEHSSVMASPVWETKAGAYLGGSEEVADNHGPNKCTQLACKQKCG